MDIPAQLCRTADMASERICRRHGLIEEDERTDPEPEQQGRGMENS